ncbi:helix-turn-helix domain-containing protein [Acidocella sp.]|uniref:helix-turn-helix domain-containing protein n=1 Tax=Acidocella sp. TaxID=50710 RepID=UPI00260BFFAE|nr:helix-turn-helix transcriptional regulator [Acidocella sp.]
MTMFAERLQSARKERKITQTRLADMLSVNPRVYNRWERGTAVPQLDTIIKIADILGVSLDALVGRENNTHQPVIHNLKLHAMLNEIDALPDEDQKALVILMDSLIKRSKINRLLAA